MTELREAKAKVSADMWNERNMPLEKKTEKSVKFKELIEKKLGKPLNVLDTSYPAMKTYHAL